jgi:serine protease Do
MKLISAATLTLLLLLADAAANPRPWAWLGVRIRDMSEQEMEVISRRHGIREGFGVVIVEVLADSPAARAGLKNGDVVVDVGGRPITETRLLQRLIAAASTTGDTPLTVLRSEGRHQLTVRLAVMPREVVGERVAAEFGFALRESEAPAESLGTRPAITVPAVAAVLRGGPAEKAGLEVGDILVQVEEQPVLTRDAARDALAEVSLDRPLRLTVRRGERRLSLALPAP